HEAPWLLFPPQEESKRKTICTLLNLEANRVIKFKDLPKVYANGCCVGSSHGWLVFLDEQVTPFLLNPFTQERIQLPSIANFLCISKIDKNCEGEFVVDFTYRDRFGSCHLSRVETKQLRESFVHKAILSSSPKFRSNTCEVVMIYGLNSKLAYYKSGEESWNDLDGKHAHYCDILFNKNKLYALSNGGFIEVWDFDGGVPIKRMDINLSFEGTKEAEFLTKELYARTVYLVESCGDILLVVRYIGELVNEAGQPVYEADLYTKEDTHPLVCPYRTLKFYVHKLDFNEGKWVEVDSLGNQTLFLGGNHSLSISNSRIKKNSIYFIDDYWMRMNEDYLYGGHDMGVFSLKDQHVKPFCTYPSEKIHPPPCWIAPN
ncbi:DUF295 domain-containing protein, partial [Cephalotus follicularis]